MTIHDLLDVVRSRFGKLLVVASAVAAAACGESSPLHSVAPSAVASLQAAAPAALAASLTAASAGSDNPATGAEPGAPLTPDPRRHPRVVDGVPVVGDNPPDGDIGAP